MSSNVFTLRIENALPGLLEEFGLTETTPGPVPVGDVSAQDLAALPLGSMESRAAARALADAAKAEEEPVLFELKVDLAGRPVEAQRVWIETVAGIRSRRQAERAREARS